MEDAETASMEDVEIATAVPKPPTVDETKIQEANKETRRKKIILFSLVATVLGAIGISAGVVLSSSKEPSVSSSSALEESNELPEPTIAPTMSPTIAPAPTLCDNANTFDTGDIRRLESDVSFQSVGCFQSQFSVDRHALDENNASESQRADDCSSRCFTRHFGVVGTTCYCYVDAPQVRLAIGSCDSVCDPAIEEDQKMELYFKMNLNSECNQDTTSAVRNFLVEEDDVPFGFDIISNEFRSSPFELYKDECGTNVYEVQTEVSEGSNELATNVKTVTEFANERRNNLSQSISTSAEASYNGLFFKASAKASASYDKEQNSMFQSSGANSDGSRVFTSLGVKRLAEVKLVDFENKRHFVTLSPEFGGLLRQYRDNGYAKSTARNLFNTYGMFVLTRGIFGGYMQLRSTVTEKDFSRYFASEEDSRQCFEAAVSARASGFGFSGSVSVEGGQCSETAVQTMQDLQATYEQEASEQTVIGGKIESGEFVVSPEFSTLLTTRDKYPAGDDGIQLRILSDFLSPEAISPLEVRRYQITENEFATIREQLQNHILEELQTIEGLIDGCDCEVPYLQQTSTGFECACYEPEPKLPGRLTAYYSFENTWNDHPYAGDFQDNLVVLGINAAFSDDVPSKAKGSTKSYAFNQKNLGDSRVATQAFSSDLTSTNQYTIMFWLQATNEEQELDNTRLATVKYDSQNQPTAEVGWQIEGFGSATNTGPDLRIQRNPSPPGNFFAKDAVGALDGQWHHIAYVVSNRDSPDDGFAYMETYVDGVSVGVSVSEGSTNKDLLQNKEGRLILGGHNDARRSASGLMDDFALFDGVVDASIIARVANGELSPSDWV